MASEQEHWEATTLGPMRYGTTYRTSSVVAYLNEGLDTIASLQTALAAAGERLKQQIDRANDLDTELAAANARAEAAEAVRDKTGDVCAGLLDALQAQRERAEATERERDEAVGLLRETRVELRELARQRHINLKHDVNLLLCEDRNCRRYVKLTAIEIRAARLPSATEGS